MKILFIHKSLVMGGAERILINYLNLLSFNNELNIGLLLLENRDNNINIEQINSKIDIHFLFNVAETKKLDNIENLMRMRGLKRKVSKLINRFYIYKMNRRINHFLSVNKPDIIINFNSHFDTFLSRNSVDIPIIRWIHGQAHLDDWTARRSWYKDILSKHNYFIAITKAMRENSLQILKSYGIEEKKIGILYNPIDIDSIRSKMLEPIYIDEKNYLLNVSRLDESKNHIQMINIYYKLKKHGVKNKLYIIGDGECRNIIEKHIKELDLVDDCILLGEIKNPYPYMRNAKLFISTSLKEGLPTVLIESMVCGTPVISMDCPTGPKEILNNGVFGPLIELGNEEQFVNVTLSLLNNIEEYRNYQSHLTSAILPFTFKSIDKKVNYILKNLSY